MINNKDCVIPFLFGIIIGWILCAIIVAITYNL